MIHYLTYLKDVIGNNYIGIKFNNDLVNPFLEKLRMYLSKDEWELFTNNQKKRDSGEYHCTVINVMDYNSISSKMGISNFISSLDKIFKFPIDDLKLMGVGSASRGDNKSFFIVCKSEKLNTIRNEYGLSEYDFHITLGFKWKDVFGVPKNQVLNPKSKFIQLLREEFYKKENFDFVKNIENFTDNPDLEIIPISIYGDYLKVICGDNVMDVSFLEENNILYIMAKYKKEEQMARMPMTEVIKKLNEDGI